jgi:hypothetical protein
MFTGRISEEDMREEHPLELEQLEREAPQNAADPALPLRRRRYVMIYGMIAALLLAGIFIFVTFEQTAIQTVVPLEPVTVLASLPARIFPQVVSFDSPMASWEDGVQQFFAMKCTLCHGSRIPLSGLDLTDYDKAILGGSSTAAIVPNDPDNSGVILQHVNGDHAVLVTQDELDRLTEWIRLGAPRQ